MERLTNGEDSWGLNEAKGLPYERKVAVIYTLLAACVADPHEVTGDTASTSVEGASKGDIIVKAGYDARQRVALRLLVLWLDIDWIKVVSLLHFVLSSSFDVTLTTFMIISVKMLIMDSYCPCN